MQGSGGYRGRRGAGETQTGFLGLLTPVLTCNPNHEVPFLTVYAPVTSRNRSHMA